MHQHSFSQGLSSFFSASCAPSLGGCSPLSRTPPAGPPIISASNGPGLPALPRRPAQSSGLPQRHPVSLAGGVVAPYAPRPLRSPSSTQRRRIRSTVALAISRDRATSSSVRPPSFRASSLSNRMRAWVCLYAAARPLETRAFSSCCSSVVSFDTVLLSRHDPLSLDTIRQCRQNTPVVPQFNDVQLLASRIRRQPGRDRRRRRRRKDLHRGGSQRHRHSSVASARR